MNLLKKDKPIKLYQHGAFYGELKYHDACVLERRIADEFYTWGWADPARRWSSPAVPMRTPIKDTSIQHANSKFHVCLVLPSIFEIEIHGFIFQQLVSDLNRAGINPLVRVRPATVENMEPEFLQSLQSVGDLSLDCDSGSKFTDILDSSGIFVFIEHPSTAFLEALRACRPSLVLVRNIHEYLPSYRCHLKALGNLKIAYSSVPSLRQRIKALNVSDPARTIDPWWSEVTSDRSFLDFRLNYCRF